MPMNVSGQGLTAMNTMGSLLPIVVVVLIASFVLALVMFFISSAARYKKLEGFIGWLCRCAGYFGWGLLAEAIGVALWLLSNWIVTPADKGGMDWAVIGTWAAYAVAFFFGTAGIGLAFKRGVGYIQRRKDKLKKELKKS